MVMCPFGIPMHTTLCIPYTMAYGMLATMAYMCPLGMLHI